MEGRYVQQFKKGALEMILLCLIAPFSLKQNPEISYN